MTDHRDLYYTYDVDDFINHADGGKGKTAVGKE